VKITKVRAVAYQVHNVMTGWKISTGGADAHRLIFVRIDTDKGVFGIGVASPGQLFISGDTETHHLELINNVLGPAITGIDPFDLETIMQKLDSVAKGAERAKAGVDIALHDLLGKALGLPVNKLFGGAVRERVRVTRLMGMYAPKEMAERCRELAGKGYTAFKLKVGTTLKEDVERVQRVREAVGPGATITIDFNMACSPKEAIERIQKMEPYDVAIVEQPVKDTDLKGMALVRRCVQPLILADESVHSSADALRIAEDQAADLISLKVPKMGGIHKARKIAAVCEGADLGYLVGTAPGSRLLDAASVHLAVSLRDLSLPCEIGEFERMGNDPCMGLEIVDGYSRPPPGPGLGVEVDLAKIGLAG